VSNVRTPKGNDIDGFNPYGNQVMHHNWMENPNATNFASNCTKVGTTYETTPTIYISSTNEGKTKVRWGAIVGQKVWKCVNVNNILFKNLLVMY